MVLVLFLTLLLRNNKPSSNSPNLELQAIVTKHGDQLVQLEKSTQQSIFALNRQIEDLKTKMHEKDDIIKELKLALKMQMDQIKSNVTLLHNQLKDDENKSQKTAKKESKQREKVDNATAIEDKQIEVKVQEVKN